MKQDLHIPVLLKEVLDTLKPSDGESYLDLTAGYGGHSGEVLKLLGKNGKATLVDRDENAFKHLSSVFSADSRVEIIHKDYFSASSELVQSGRTFDVILADIGVSSPHLDNPDRGFSFMNEGPLDMRMDSRTSLSAADVVNTLSKDELADILYKYGELKNSRNISKIIVDNRPFATTSDLSSVIPGSHKFKIRTLAQLFQALRIYVNDELNQLSNSLPMWHSLLKPGGRLGVITFHSLEDRIVKQYFQEYASDTFENNLKLVTKGPITASPDELVSNPRARSAKLRVVQRK